MRHNVSLDCLCENLLLCDGRTVGVYRLNIQREKENGLRYTGDLVPYHQLSFRSVVSGLICNKTRHIANGITAGYLSDFIIIPLPKRVLM